MWWPFRELWPLCDLTCSVKPYRTCKRGERSGEIFTNDMLAGKGRNESATPVLTT